MNAHNFKSSKQKKAADLVEKLLRSGISSHLSLQNVAEFYNVAKNSKKIGKERAYEIAKEIIYLSNFQMHEPKKKDLLNAMKINQEFNIHFWDAMIAAVMLRTGIPNIYTEDEDFKKISWINTINPYDND